jgi:hypothetical protein
VQPSSELREFRFRFDALGGRRHAERATNVCNRSHDGNRVWIGREILYERSVDLDFVERKFA